MSSVKSDTLIRNRKVTNPQERINCKLLVGPVPHAYSGRVFLFNSGGFLDSVLDGIIFVRYCTFILCGLMNDDEVRVI